MPIGDLFSIQLPLEMWKTLYELADFGHDMCGGDVTDEQMKVLCLLETLIDQWEKE